MRDNVRAFVAVAAAAWKMSGPVFEFGSYQVAGQADVADLRSLFPHCEYTGCDMRPGPGVDRIEDLSRLLLPDGCAQTVICVDTLEHVFDVKRAVEEMLRILAPGGYLLISAPMDFRVHDYPSDYWRITPSCLARLLAPLDAAVIGSQGVENYPHTVMGVGCKGPVPQDFGRNAERFIADYQAWLNACEAGRSPWRRSAAWLRNLLLSRGERQRRTRVHEARFAVQSPAACLSTGDLVEFMQSPRGVLRSDVRA